MAEEVKYKILNFLQERKGEEFSILRLKKEMEKAGIKYHYQTILKWVLVLEAERKINLKDYGNSKIIKSVEDDRKP